MARTSNQLAQQARGIFKRADAEGREPTIAEREEVERLLDQASAQKNVEDGFKTLEPDTPIRVQVAGDGSDSGSFGGPGDRFVTSEGFKRISDPSTRGQSWSSGAIEVSSGSLGSYQAKAGTLLESGQGAGLVPVPQVLPGIRETLFEPLAVADLFAQQQATTSSFRYTTEGTATSGAAGVAEGAAKPASDLALSTVDEPIRKIATSLVVSDELLDDVASVQTYLNSRLGLFVKIEEEQQLLRGGGAPELAGLIGRSGINSYARGTVDNNAVAVAKVIANTRGSSFLEPDAVIMHPTNWLSTRLLTDSAGQFFGGGPFSGAYGNAGAATTGMFGQSLWGKPVALSTVVGPGTAVVGSFSQGALVLRRGGVTVEASNSHADLFLSNQVAIRAEERLGLACFRPSSFTVLSGLS